MRRRALRARPRALHWSLPQLPARLRHLKSEAQGTTEALAAGTPSVVQKPPAISKSIGSTANHTLVVRGARKPEPRKTKITSSSGTSRQSAVPGLLPNCGLNSTCEIQIPTERSKLDSSAAVATHVPTLLETMLCLQILFAPPHECKTSPQASSTSSSWMCTESTPALSQWTSTPQVMCDRFLAGPPQAPIFNPLMLRKPSTNKVDRSPNTWRISPVMGSSRDMAEVA